MSLSKIVGIRKESKSEFERRVPLVPSDIQDLQKNHPITFTIQPAAQRAIPLSEFEAVGVTPQQDMSQCDLIIGVKEVPNDEILENKTYCFFSHVIKGQPSNMPMLRKLMNNGCTLIDYEKMTDERGLRVVAFGRQAGIAGTINAFHSLNKRLAALNQEPNPFQPCKQSSEYPSIAAAKETLRQVGQNILENGLPENLAPFIVLVTGAGNVSGGVFDVLESMPCLKEWNASDLIQNVENGNYDSKSIYKVVLDAGDLYEHKTEPNRNTFTFSAFGASPSDYQSTVSRYFPYSTILINAVFWKPEFPKFITKNDFKEIYSAPKKPRSLVIADVTCDIDGSLECTTRSTMPNNPSYVYNPFTGETKDGFQGEGLVVMAVDILPTEFPIESSTCFSKALTPLLAEMALTNYNQTFAELKINPILKRAIILLNGELTPDYSYLSDKVPQ